MWKIDWKEFGSIKPGIERLYEKKTALDNKRPLSGSALRKIKESLHIEWTYNSNSIEGNTLSLRETQLVLQEGITIGGKTLREHFEAHNHEKAIGLLYEMVHKDYVLDCKDILSIHGVVLRSIEDEFAGRIRNGGVRISGANFLPPAANKVSDLLDELIAYINQNPDSLTDLELATIFHHRLVWIHPFFDGNGRTARLTMNLLLMRSGFPPAIILKVDRKKYYDALNQANQGKYAKLGLLMCQAAERTLNIYHSALPDSGYEFRDIQSLVTEEPEMPYNAEYISLLARQGKIDAHKEGHVWYTSRQAVNNYVNTRKRKRKLE